MRTSDQIDQIALALAKSQGEFPRIEKGKKARVQTKTGGSYEYAYADIADVLSAVLPVLSRNELAIIQPTIQENGAISIRSRLLHKSGQWIESDYPVCLSNGQHQAMGAALTYSRRYALCSLLGIAADEDTDGQDAAELPGSKPARKSSAAAKRDGKHDEIEKEVTACATLEALYDWEDANAGLIWDLPVRWREEWLPEIIERRHAELLAAIATPEQVAAFGELRGYINRATTPPALKQKAESNEYKAESSALPALLQDTLRRIYKRRMHELKALGLVA